MSAIFMLGGAPRAHEFLPVTWVPGLHFSGNRVNQALSDIMLLLRIWNRDLLDGP